MYLSSSLDVWNIVASTCLVTITIFLCWSLYELMRVLRQTNEMITEFRERVAVIEEAIEAIQEKLSSFAGIAGMVVNAGKQVISTIGSGKESKKRALKKQLKELEDES